MPSSVSPPVQINPGPHPGIGLQPPPLTTGSSGATLLINTWYPSQITQPEQLPRHVHTSDHGQQALGTRLQQRMSAGCRADTTQLVFTFLLNWGLQKGMGTPTTESRNLTWDKCWIKAYRSSSTAPHSQRNARSLQDLFISPFLIFQKKKKKRFNCKPAKILLSNIPHGNEFHGSITSFS